MTSVSEVDRNGQGPAKASRNSTWLYTSPLWTSTDPLRPSMGWWPASLRSMMESRRWANPARASGWVQIPASSGPRWACRAVHDLQFALQSGYGRLAQADDSGDSTHSIDPRIGAGAFACGTGATRSRCAVWRRDGFPFFSVHPWTTALFTGSGRGAGCTGCGREPRHWIIRRSPSGRSTRASKPRSFRAAAMEPTRRLTRPGPAAL